MFAQPVDRERTKHGCRDPRRGPRPGRGLSRLRASSRIPPRPGRLGHEPARRSRPGARRGAPRGDRRTGTRAREGTAALPRGACRGPLDGADRPLRRLRRPLRRVRAMRRAGAASLLMAVLLLLGAAQSTAEPRQPVVRTAPRTHVVASGDTLGAIAARYKVTVAALVAANRLTNEKVTLKLGQRLVIPAAAPTQAGPTQAAPTQAAPRQAAPTQTAPTQAAPSAP